MRFLIKLITFPIIIFLTFIQLILEGATRICCYVAGFVINILIVLGLIAIFSKQWFALAIHGGLFVGCIGILALIGMISVLLNGIKEKVKRI